MQVRLLHGFVGAKFSDVGTAGKCLAGTGDDDGAHRIVCQSAVQAAGNALPGGQAQTIDRRVGQRDDGDVAAMDLVFSTHA